MAQYKLEIFDAQGVEPILSQHFDADDDTTALAVAKRQYEKLAKAVKVAGFVLYKGRQAICRHQRWIH
jgi:hypothetical protein